MNYCVNDGNSTYTGKEPSPKGLGYCAHAVKLGEIMIGKNKKEWIIVETKNKIKKWVPYNEEFITNEICNIFSKKSFDKKDKTNLMKLYDINKKKEERRQEK